MSQNTWLTPFVPFIEAFFSMAIAAFMAFAAKVLWDKWGIDIDGSHRQAFQTAAKNAGSLVSSGATVMDAVTYVQEHVPDAVKHFDLKPRSIEETIMAQLGQIIPATAVVKAIVEKSPAVDTRKRPGPKPAGK